MADISKIKLPDNSTYNVKDANALPKSGGTLMGRVITTKPLNDIITGTGVAGQDKGSGVSPRYFPATWTFNTGLTATDGDVIIIKTPNAGHDYGVFVSIDNGSNYYPVSLTIAQLRLGTHYGDGAYLALTFISDGGTKNVFPLAGGDARVNVTGGAWYVINYYDSDYRVKQTNTTTNATYNIPFSYSTSTTTEKTEQLRKSAYLTFNPSTKTLTVDTLANGVKTTTQVSSDNSTKIATTAFVKNNIDSLMKIYVDDNNYISIDYGGDN